MQFGIWSWVLFNAFVLGMLALDLGVFHRTPHKIQVREALTWTAVWISLACIFGFGIYLFEGHQLALEFFTGFVVEKSLSIDNIFVIFMIFAYFKVPARYQHEILFWGILGALVMRALFILGGIALIQQYHSVIYVLGAFLVFSGIKMALPKKEEITLDKNFVLRMLRTFLPVTEAHEDDKFFVRTRRTLAVTPLFVALVMVEATDIIFAVDSIPAILAISSHPFIVYTSNAFALLGMRSLFFAVSKLINLFRFMSFGLATILVFIGVKMLFTDVFTIPTIVAMSFVIGTLSLSVLASIIWPSNRT